MKIIGGKRDGGEKFKKVSVTQLRAAEAIRSKLDRVTNNHAKVQ